jgi:hypothetical protein
MKTFFKRNRMIKLFTIGWVSLMAVISAVLLLWTPQMNPGGATSRIISGGNISGNGVYSYALCELCDMMGTSPQNDYCSIDIRIDQHTISLEISNAARSADISQKYAIVVTMADDSVQKRYMISRCADDMSGDWCEFAVTPAQDIVLYIDPISSADSISMPGEIQPQQEWGYEL